MSEPVLEYRDVTADYGGEPILRSVSLAFGEAEFVGLVGPNGSGKSTLLKAAVGLIPAHSGEVKLFGQPLSRFNEWRRVGYVPQHQSLFPHRTVRGNVAYSVEVLEGSLASARAIASNVRRAFVSGAPTFPRATVSLPPTVERSAPIAIAVPPGAHYRLAATGAYVAKGESGPVLRPFAKGPVSVTAIVSDELGRVTEVTATSLAR